MNDQDEYRRQTEQCLRAAEAAPQEIRLRRFSKWGNARLANATRHFATCKAIDGIGADVFRHACAMGLEGSVLTRLGSTYRAGRSPDWIRTKNPDWKRR
jgi:ATP-dependent DNA ligase